MTTVTSTAPVPAGLVAVICVAELTVKLLAATVAELHRRGTGKVRARDRHRRAARRRARARADARHLGAAT